MRAVPRRKRAQVVIECDLTPRSRRLTVLPKQISACARNPRPAQMARGRRHACGVPGMWSVPWRWLSVQADRWRCPEVGIPAPEGGKDYPW